MQTGFAERPALVVGVTGHMCLIDLPDHEQKQIRDSVERVLRSFREIDPQRHSVAESESRNGHASESTLPLGIQLTPITVLTSLAPGADTLVADVAEELQRKLDTERNRPVESVELPGDEFHEQCQASLVDGREDAYRVVALLPFPIDLYVQATTFKNLTENERHAVKQRLEQLGDRAIFVRLAEDRAVTCRLKIFRSN